MADQKEHFNENQLEDAIRRGHDLVKSEIWTSLPCKIVAFNAAEQSVTVQPLIQSKVRQSDGTYVDKDMAQYRDIPVQFPSGGGWSITFPLKAGDEGTIEFQSRCLDNWWLPPANAKAGTPQPQAEMRMHDANDGIFKPGARSKPRWLKDVSASTVQLRSDDGRSYIELASGTNGGVANLVFPDGVTITAPFVRIVGGELRAEKEVTSFYGTGNSVTSSMHKHTQPNDSHGDVEQDTRVPIAGT